MYPKRTCLFFVILLFVSFSDGKMFGYGFVQFSKITEAAAAIKSLNTKPILGESAGVYGMHLHTFRWYVGLLFEKLCFL